MNRLKGFTIAELAVAVAIIAVLLFGAMVPFSAQVDIRNVAETRRTLDAIREAIIGFAQANGRLPCPANGNVASGTAGAGAEQFDGTNCVAAAGSGVFGVVPWATLGTQETDSWGRRFSYRVSPAFADAVLLPSPPAVPGTLRRTWNTRATTPYAPAPGFIAQNTTVPLSPGDQPSPQCDLTTAPTQSSFALCTLGDMTVYTRTSPAIAAAVQSTALPVVIISHGKNGNGAWQPNGTQLTAAAAGTDEAANAAGTTTSTSGGFTTATFFSRSPTSSASGCGDPAVGATGAGPFCEFDDIVITISVNALIARMVAAGKLP